MFGRNGAQTAEPEQKLEPEPWTVEYTAHLDDGTTHSWQEEVTHEGDDRHAKAGWRLLAYKYGHYSQVFDGKLYPPHRLREVTWRVL